MSKLSLFFILMFYFVLGFANEVLTIQVPAGASSVTVSLAANPTTGFKWEVLQYDQKIMKLASQSYQKKPSKLIGSGGTTVFIFNLNKNVTLPEKSLLLFNYARPWEAKGSTQQAVQVYFK